LCPEEKRDEDGKCPGGLSVAQWERIEYAANNRMTEEAREMVLDLLNRGKIRARTVVINRGRSVAAEASPLMRRVTIAERSFDYGLGDFAFLLAHEAQHTTQLFMWPTKREADADAYACANTWGRSGYRAGAYRRTLGPCGSGLP